MQTTSNPIKLNPSVAEQRRPIPIPAPFAGASKALQKEFDVLQARSDSLETDRGHAAQHRSDFAKELEAMTETMTVANDDPAKGVVGIVEDKSIAWEAMTVRDIVVGLLRKELTIRADLDGYLGHWLEEGRKAATVLRKRLEETRADITKRLIKFGYDDPATSPLSASRVLPGYVFCHPEVWAAKRAYDAANGSISNNSWIQDNNREVEELRRLIRSEVARLAGLSVV